MNIEKLKEWMDFAQTCGEGDMWAELFDVKGEQWGKKRPGKSEFPLADIYQTNNEIIVLIEIPGVKKTDLILSVSGNFLYLKGSPRISVIDGQQLQSERYTGIYERKIQLPCTVEDSFISAGMEDGLLTIRFRHAGREQKRILLD